MGYQERLAGPHTQRVELKQQQDKPDKKQSAEQDDGSVPYLTILNMILVLGQGVIFYLQLRVMGRIVGIYGQQANTMDRQADIANSQTEILRQQTANSIATDRALVWLRKMRMTPIVHPGFTTVVSWAFQPIWENSGDTATRRGLNHINWELFRERPPETHIFVDRDPDILRQQLVIGPRNTVTGHAHNILSLFANSHKSGIGFLMLWGWFEYDDRLGSTERHRTEFCGYPLFYGDPRDPNCAVTFIYYGRHNGIDDECQHKPKTAMSHGISPEP